MSDHIFKNTCVIKLLETLPDKSVQLFLQDLPYGTTKNKWDKKIDLPKLWKQMLRVGVDNAAYVFTATMPFACEVINSMPSLFRYDIVWHKPSCTGHLNANKQPLRGHELILVFYAKSPIYNPQKTKGHTRKVSTTEHKRNSAKTDTYGKFGLSSYDSTERYPTSIITFPTDNQKIQSLSAQKPVDLNRWIIRTYTNIGDVVCDGVVGGGSTYEATVLEDRVFIGSELSNDRFLIAKSRIEHLQR